MLARLARFCFRRRWTVVIGWLLAIVLLGIIGFGVVGNDYRTDFNLPDSETKQVFDFLKANRPDSAGFTGQIVFQDKDGVSSPEVQAALTPLFQKVDKIDGVSVVSPFTPEGARQISSDGTIGYATLDFKQDTFAETQDRATKIQDLGDKVKLAGLRIEYGSQAFQTQEMPASEALGLLAAAIILLIAFGSVLAMGLPIGTALIGLASGSALVVLVSNLTTMPEFTPEIAAMIGLGVGIDYALFIVTRHREGLHNGLSPEDAAVASVDTAGRAVLFAGGTVIISLLGLFVAGLAFVSGLAVAGICAVVAMVAASLTLLPALLGFSGSRIEVTTYRGLLALIVPVMLAIPAVIFGVGALFLFGLAFSVVILVTSIFVPKLREQVPIRQAVGDKQGFWYRWSHLIQRRPWPAFAFGLIVLVVLAIPSVLHPPRVRRRGQPPREDHPAPGLRPVGQGLRTGLQRPAPDPRAERGRRGSGEGRLVRPVPQLGRRCPGRLPCRAGRRQRRPRDGPAQERPPGRGHDPTRRPPPERHRAQVRARRQGGRQRRGQRRFRLVPGQAPSLHHRHGPDPVLPVC